jgi:hypothetical protein
MIAIVLLILVIAMGGAAALGLTPDSRDPRYGIGPFFLQNEREEPRHAEAGTAEAG